MKKTVFLFSLCLMVVSCMENSAPQERVRQCYEQGKAYRQSGEPVAAMQCFLEATQVPTDDLSLLGRVYSNMANMCRQAERHETAYAIYGLSTEQFSRAGDTLAIAYALHNMAWEQAVMGHKDTALALIDSALSACPSETVRAKVKEAHAAACLYAQEYDSAIGYARCIEDTLYGSIIMAQAYAMQQQNDSALRYARRIIESTSNPRYLDDLLYILAHCDSTAERSHLIALTERRTDVQRELEQYKSQMAQAVLLLEQSRSTTHTTLWWIIAGIALGITGIIGLRCIPRTNRRRQIEQIASRLRQDEPLSKDIPWNLFDIPTKLRERGLTDREVRIATLVLFGLSYAQMAEILHRAENGIGKDKYLIAKKLGVSAKDLRSTLLEIACRQ